MVIGQIRTSNWMGEFQMDILISTTLLNYTGVPTYTLTLYNQLVARGHKVTVYCPKNGQLSSRMKVISSLEFAGWPDVILAQHNTLAREMRKKWPDIPMIFISHGISPNLEQPPTDIKIDKYIAVSEEVILNLESYNITNMKLVRNFIDIDRFYCKEPVRDKPERLLFISNHARERRRTYKTIQKVCKIMKIKFKLLDFATHPKFNIEDYINETDIVISLGRGILEAMACWRPVIVFDRRRGDGYINEGTYRRSRMNNFSGRAYFLECKTKVIIDEIKKYHPDDGITNRNIILKHHNHIKGVDSIMEIIGEII